MCVFEILSSLFMLLCSIVGIVCSLIFIIVLIIDRQCRRMTTLLVLNSVIAGFLTNIIYTCQALYQLTTDGNDNLCVFRGFMLHAGCGLLYHTFCAQAFYRLSVTIPIRRQYLQSKGFIMLFVLFQWLISFTFGLPILLMGRIKFQAGSRICQVSLDDIFGFLYLATGIYGFPVLTITGIYIRIIIYIKQKSFPTIILRNFIEQQRQRRELRLLRRVIIPVIVLYLMGLPYLITFLTIHFSHVPTSGYIQRICFMFISFGQGISMLLCLINTDNVRKYLANASRNIKRRKKQQRRVPNINVIQLPVQIAPVHTM